MSEAGSGAGDVTAGSSEGIFGGGGFVKAISQQRDSAAYRSRDPSKSTLVPVTVKQLSDADRRTDGSTFIRGLELSTVRLVGQMLDRVIHENHITFTVDDGTGKIKVQRWFDGQWESTLLNKIRDAQYVTVHGCLRSTPYRTDLESAYPFPEDPTTRILDAFDVRAVEDFNFIPFHFIQCIHVDTELAKEEKKAIKAIQTTPVLTQSSTESDDITRTAYYMVVGALRDPAVRGMEHGISYRYIKRKTHLPDDLIGPVLAHLADQGDIYTTIDEKHYKWSTE